MIIFQPFSHTSMCNQRKGTEALQTDVNNILYVLLSKMGFGISLPLFLQSYHSANE